MPSNTSKNKPISRRERELARHRQEMLEAAQAVFSEYGFEKARMEDIAQRAEFAVGTLYRFFSSKDQLYLELLRDKADVMEVRIEEAINAGNTPLEKVRNIFFTRLDLFWDHKVFFRLLVQETEGSLHKPRLCSDENLAARYHQFLEQLEAFFEAGIRESEFRDVPPHCLLTAFEGILRNYVAHLGYLDQDASRDPVEEQAMFQLFCEGARRVPESD